MSTALRIRADSVLETLHAIEPATHRFNLLVIAAGPGMLSPVVAIAAVVSLVCLHMWEWALDHRYGGSSHNGGSDSQRHRHNTTSVQMAHTMHPLPIDCVRTDA